VTAGGGRCSARSGLPTPSRLSGDSRPRARTDHHTSRRCHLAKRAAVDADDERRNFGGEEIAPNTNDDDVIGDVAELDDPTYADAKWNVYRLNDDGQAPPGSRVGAFVCRLVGPIELDKLRERVGGGVFRLIGSLPSRGRVWTVVTIDGPRRIEPPIAAAPNTNPYLPPTQPMPPAYGYPPNGWPVDPMQAMREELRELRRDVAAKSTVAADPIAMLGAVIQLVKDNAPAAPPAPTEAVIGPILSMLDKGIRLGRGERGEGGGGNGELGAIVRESLPVILQSLGQLLRPNAPPAPPVQHGERVRRESSSAEVIEPTTKPRATPAADDPAHMARRLDEIARLLAEAIDAGTPADTLIDLAEEKLTGEELDQLSQPGATAGHVLEALTPARVSQYPAFGIVDSDQRSAALAYIGSFLQALRER
jgi:hypothetical protein